MTTKMKGLFKGLRYISQIFEEEKEQEMQIGLPTDVKHVAHIGWDGPSVESPSWMKEFKSSTGFQSAPLGPPPGEPREDPEIKWVSEDSRRGTKATNSVGKDSPEVPKSSRRSADPNESPGKKDSTTKSRQTRKKDSSEGSVKSSRQPSESSVAADSPSRSLPDIPKKSRRKKSKESVGSGGSTRSRSKPAPANETSDAANDSMLQQTSGSGPGPIPGVHDEEKERRVMFKD